MKKPEIIWWPDCFRCRSKNKPAPAELWKEIEGIDHLVYYDWEMTSDRLQQWRLLSQMLPVLPCQRPGLSHTRAVAGKTNMVAGKTNSSVAAALPREAASFHCRSGKLAHRDWREPGRERDAGHLDLAERNESAEQNADAFDGH